MKKNPPQPKQQNKEIGYIKPREIVQEMKDSYIDYAISVIVSRALPDVRDGLKPVHRRILYAMLEDGLTHGAKFRKSASVIGSTLSRYHPHGDMAVYDALVRMAQDFSLRYPLIQGQGNFGCFTKNTKVKLCDGRNLNFGELIKEQKKGKKHWTFTFNPQTKKIEIAEIKNPRKTRANERIIEITLDNDEKVKCTPDHRFMLRDGTYIQARDLKPGDSLMPLNKQFALAKTKTTSKEVAFADSQSSSTPWSGTPIIANPETLSRGKTLKAVEVSGVAPERVSLTKEISNYSTPTANPLYQNHKVIKTRVLQKREDVYDLTIEPWHNFALAAGIFVHNSIDGDSAAAYRYTEARLSKIGEETLKDINKDTVDFVDNYDATRKEPTVLPSPLPQLLLNGCLGIAVGMATNIPPHNLKEVCDAAVYLLDRPKATVEDLFKFIKGPDFPTGGQIFNQKEIITAYSQGKGPILTRGKTDIIEKKGGFQIIITEIPYQVQKSTLVQQFARLVEEKKIEAVKDIRDESDREGLRIVFDLKRDAFPQKILNRLYKFSDLQKTFYLNMLALVDRIQPRVLSLAEILNYFLLHRQEVILRRTKYDLERAKERAHILEGLKKCLSKIDEVIRTIKKSENREAAKKNLIKKFRLTQIQAEAILETKLSALARLERKKIEDELKEKKRQILEFSAILKSPKKVKELIKKELKEVKENFGDERRTKVFPQKVGEIAEEDLIPQKEMIITLTQGGYIKRIDPKIYKIQKRGGKGILGMKTMGEDVVEHFLLANNHDDLLFFSDSGKVFKTKVYEIPEGSRLAKGRGLLNFLEISPQEKVLTLMSLVDETKVSSPPFAVARAGKEDEAKGIKYLAMATKNGIVKKTNLLEFQNVRRTGLIAISLKKGDLLRQVKKTSGQDEIVLVTKRGQSIRFKEKEIREMGRQAAGNRGIRLKKGDELVGMEIIKNLALASQKLEKKYLLIVTKNGYGKRTDLKEYRLQGRGGSGIKTAKVIEKTGDIISSKILEGPEEDLIVISQKGQVIRIKLSQIPKLGRATQGVRIMRLEEGDRVASVTYI